MTVSWWEHLCHYRVPTMCKHISWAVAKLWSLLEDGGFGSTENKGFFLPSGRNYDRNYVKDSLGRIKLKRFVTVKYGMGFWLLLFNPRCGDNAEYLSN